MWRIWLHAPKKADISVAHPAPCVLEILRIGQPNNWSWAHQISMAHGELVRHRNAKSVAHVPGCATICFSGAWLFGAPQITFLPIRVSLVVTHTFLLAAARRPIDHSCPKDVRSISTNTLVDATDPIWPLLLSIASSSLNVSWLPSSSISFCNDTHESQHMSSFL
jgi:hypothetical protein